MRTTEISFDEFIKGIVNDGIVASEAEAERIVFSILERRKIDKKIAIAQEQVKNGRYTEINDEFMENFLREAEERNARNFKQIHEKI
uniref:Antitoxin ParD1/3/4 n=1 Tax=Candidatus Kentrum sp. TC TaxID=2126339 RepID=A0A450YKJ6_9GAMM|nr:MAG: hypothetical protein BECKTC1821E_GA0114239_101629 [Candidatus Kentron sp. TC]